MRYAKLSSLLIVALLSSPIILAQVPACSNPAYVVSGIDFSPYGPGQNPNLSPQISATQIQARMQVIAPCTSWVRTYSATHGLESAGTIAHSLGLKIAAGAWLGRDLQSNQNEINGLINMAQNGQADVLVVGSEVLLRGDLTDSQLIGYINQVRQAAPGIPVTTADVYDVLLIHPQVIAACDEVFANYFPYWQGISIDLAIGALDKWHKQMVAAAGGKPVIVSETGWPSDGNVYGNAVPSAANASYYFLDFVSWARANNVSYFYFEAYDEAWKAQYEGPQGAHWGILDQNGILKPGMDAVFAGNTLPCNWGCGPVGGPGTPSISLTYVPTYGTGAATLYGQVLHVAPASNSVVVYLSVNGGSTWWVKPYFTAPLTAIQNDGTWSTNVNTGGIDYVATNFAAFLIPNICSPPLLGNQPLPADVCNPSLANIKVARSQNNISGSITDAGGNALSGITVNLSGSETQSTVTFGGRYSFFNLQASTGYTVTPQATNYAFTPSSQPVPTLSGNYSANFVGESAIPSPVSVTPITSSGISQSLTLTFADAIGYGNIKLAAALINGSLSSKNACYVYYNQANNNLYLLNDAATVSLGPLKPGKSGTLSNSQCTLNGPGSTVSGSGQALTLTLSLTATSSFIGSKNVYMEVIDNGGLNSGWYDLGTWAPASDVAPTADSVSPNPAAGTNVTLSLNYSAQNGRGYADLTMVEVLVNAGLNSKNACYVYYTQATNSLYLLNDAATASLGPLNPGTNGTLSNSQCTVNGLGTTISGTGQTLKLAVSLSAAPAFLSTKNIYMRATDSEGLTRGWVNRGTWIPASDPAPSADSVTPNPATGANVTLSLNYSAQNGRGYADLTLVEVLVNAGLNSKNACYVYYNQATNNLYLLNDGATASLGPLIPGTSGTLSNSQCSVNGLGTTVSAAGQTLTLAVSLSATANFVGSKNVYMRPTDSEGSKSVWTNCGTWDIP